MAAAHSEVPSFEASRYVEVLHRRRRVVAACTVLGLALALLYLVATPHATATATVQVDPIGADPFSSGRAPSTLLDAQTEEQVAQSQAVVRAAADKLGTDAQDVRRSVRATLLPGGTVVQIQYAAPSAARAAAGANAVARAYLAQRGLLAEGRQKAVSDKLERRRTALLHDLEAANRTIANGLKGSTSVNYAQSQRQLILIELNSLFTSINGVVGVDTRGGSMLDAAKPSGAQAGSRAAPLLLTGALGGLLVGLAAAFAADAGDRRLRDDVDASRAGSGPVLGRLGARGVELPARGADLDDVRVLRERVLALVDERGGTVAVLDELGGAETTDVGGNLAVALAETGRRVRLVVDRSDRGLLDVLAAGLELRPAEPAGALPQDHSVLVSGLLAGLVVDVSDGQSYVASPRAPHEVTVVVLPHDASRATRLAAGRGSDVVVAVEPEGVRRAEVRGLVRDLDGVGSGLDGLVLAPRSRSVRGGPAADMGSEPAESGSEHGRRDQVAASS